jgi:hypothetical protein
VWCYTFSDGFVLLDDPAGDAVPVRWGQVTAVDPVSTGYRLGKLSLMSDNAICR